jgi:hypothetical protein
MVEIAITINEAKDNDFVDEQVGAAFYTHLRGLDRVADARCESVERAVSLYQKAVDAGESEPRVAGYSCFSGPSWSLRTYSPCCGRLVVRIRGRA